MNRRNDELGAAVVTAADQPRTNSMARVALACYVGSAIEFYDFLIYGTAAALVFPVVFFPHLSPTVATVASMGTFAAAFLSRPLGAAVFGYYGDRLGRKKTLMATLLIMAVSTVSVGLVPTTAEVGAVAPLMLAGLRLLQGFAVGGEWAGSALLSVESAPPDKRGRYGMFTLIGGGTATVIAGITFLGVSFTIGENSRAFLDWGWRVPFLISAVLIVIALYVRLNIEETPVFAVEKARNLVPDAPVAEVLRLQRREVLLGAGSVLTPFALVYMASTFLPGYTHNHLGFSRVFILSVGVLGGLVSIASVATSAMLCDRYGRRRLMLLGYGACLPWSLLVMPLIGTGSPVGYAVAIVGIYGLVGIGSGPTASFIPELFDTRYRYTGSALSVNLGGIAGGAVPPLIAGTLIGSYGSWSVGVLLAGLVATSLACTYLLPETNGTVISWRAGPR
ncbi:MFS transporter [Mycobacterium kiyosense]|uniref:MFS transporter n=2 Tax=Mycobacteriaceae TaxID=1762 RepID=A0A9P3Q5P0_9MYCO|nr:MFS transporter [Mycobacterium kiyosense]BDE15930.1 MFS transporter [Mycobacterium sp. 20KCMC460]GLB81763.1 MFS transporter [Mycobacterium kiyosense]GLB90373.1 MFS transporter [Mycobacterium kiyosense]GLC02140.1 MFS transporter [Mycobacterium kiyosense]